MDTNLDDPRLLALGIKGTTLRRLIQGEIPLAARTRVKTEALLSVIRESTRLYNDMPRVNSPRAAGAYLLGSSVGRAEEYFGILCLNVKGDLLSDAIVGMGTCSAVIISPREIFREALRHGAASVIVYHNHPSGDPTPSREDVSLTKRLRVSGESIGVIMVDHIIIGAGEYYSFRAAEGWDHN